MAERFDLYDADGRPLGRSKERLQVHMDGDWHRSLGLWIVRHDGRLLFQCRSAGKDTWPGRLTASVSGHYAAGERLEDVLREANEELGVEVGAAELIPLGLWRYDDARVPGIFDRELQDIFLWPLDLPLTSFRPDAEEVTALVELWPADMLDLLAGRVPGLAADRCEAGTTTIQRVWLTLDDFVPDHAYHRSVCEAAVGYAQGSRDLHLRTAGRAGAE